ncbi:NADH-quinone oxidoreductase subunit NuoE [Sulfurospirillum arcachonense]|uniref:NADH-quinone oxidoreductase subunit NuoE n=1 Tax=Sulfurospirillum arcachonense TaxID=57666 RepID=UPI00046ADC71|nr:NADH-quinone oxidoreductase subunit NuoE [Sulfurospirillum arcachonense]
MSEFKFSEENEKKFQELLKRYPDRASLSLPSLWMIQYQEGWISEEAMVFLADKLGTSPMDIQGIASFYTMFNLEPIGKYHIQVCKTLSCKLCGSEKIKSHIENKLGVKFGETTKDMKFTLTEVECLGSCGTAPAMSFNDDYVENLTVEKIDELLDTLK